MFFIKLNDDYNFNKNAFLYGHHLGRLYKMDGPGR